LVAERSLYYDARSEKHQIIYDFALVRYFILTLPALLFFKVH